VADDRVNFRELIFDDVKRGKLGQAYRRDIQDIYRFYLTAEQRERLAAMRPFKRFFWIAGWLSRNLLRRLSPSRQLLLMLSVLLFMFRVVVNRPRFHLDLDTSRLAIFPVLLVLMLELKDKLLARDRSRAAGAAVAASDLSAFDPRMGRMERHDTGQRRRRRSDRLPRRRRWAHRGRPG
jgi:hypothetical protein